MLTSLLLTAALLLNVAPYPRASVVEIKTVTDGQEAGCTGFYVKPTVIITAAHCAGEVVFASGGPLLLIKKDDTFAAYLTPEVRWPLPLGRPAKSGDILTSVGNAYSQGNLNLIRRVARIDKGHIWVDGPIASGMSGGPMLNEKGEVVGLNQAANAVFGIACGVDEIRAFLNE